MLLFFSEGVGFLSESDFFSFFLLLKAITLQKLLNILFPLIKNLGTNFHPADTGRFHVAGRLTEARIAW